MLFHRILTAVPLALAVIWVILYQSTSIVFYALLLITMVSGYEWAQLGGLRSKFERLIYAVVIVAVCWILVEKLNQYAVWVVYAAVFWWILVTLFLFNARPEEKGLVFSASKLLSGVFVISAAVFSMVGIHSGHMGAQWLLYGLSLVWVADIGAYFSGKKYGKTKLAPFISPGKTIEGLYGAMVATFVYAVMASSYFNLDSIHTVYLLIITAVLTLISITGDLFESLLKRESGLKDSGTILPGHGGALDRIDGVLSAMPIFFVGFNWFLYPASQM